MLLNLSWTLVDTHHFVLCILLHSDSKIFLSLKQTTPSPPPNKQTQQRCPHLSLSYVTSLFFSYVTEKFWNQKAVSHSFLHLRSFTVFTHSWLLTVSTRSILSSSPITYQKLSVDSTSKVSLLGIFSSFLLMWRFYHFYLGVCCGFLLCLTASVSFSFIAFSLCPWADVSKTHV